MMVPDTRRSIMWLCRVLGEARNIAQLQHPNVVGYHNCWLEVTLGAAGGAEEAGRGEEEVDSWGDPVSKGGVDLEEEIPTELGGEERKIEAGNGGDEDDSWSRALTPAGQNEVIGQGQVGDQGGGMLAEIEVYIQMEHCGGGGGVEGVTLESVLVRWPGP